MDADLAVLTFPRDEDFNMNRLLGDAVYVDMNEDSVSKPVKIFTDEANSSKT